MLSLGVPSMRAHTSLSQQNTMAAASFLVLIVLAAAATSSAVKASEITNGSCIPAERAALLSFKAGIMRDLDNRLISWRQGHDCCRWSGVTCSSRTGHVVKLDLRGRSPTEDDVVDLKDISLLGKVSSSLLALRHSLRHLDLSGNILLGAAMAMPEFLGSLQSLTYLNLSDTGFVGRVPPQLGNLSKLVHLDIGGVYSDINLYSLDISWLARLRSLEHLSMDSIFLEGVVDALHTVNAIPNLVVLTLSFCDINMSNAQSSLLHHNLTFLEELDLSGNSFNNLAAPKWLWGLSTLKSLRLGSCELSGTYPDELGNLTLLETFDISYNYNIRGMLPGTLQHMCNLRSLGLGGNNIGGDITEIVHKIPNCSWNNLQELNLMDANITGTTLEFLSNLTSLSKFDVSRNQLRGSLPMEIGMLTSLTYLDLGSNNLIGAVPMEIGMLTNLTYLDLGNNNLTGSVPVEIGMLTKLTYLDLANNKLSGSVPMEIGALTSLATLELTNNDLSGVISEYHLAGLMNLKIIDLSHNNFQFTIGSHWVPRFNLYWASFSSCHLGPQFPKWLRSLKGIGDLRISNTGLVGRIPNWFWTTFSDAASLDISLNQLSGKLPLDIEFMSVSALSMHSNMLTGLIPRLPRTVALLDISRNSINGFASNFQASGLQVAILFSNSISGTIPMSICQLRKLQVLDLSNNMLSGGLPDCGGKEVKQKNPSINNTSRVKSISSYSLQITTLLLSNNSLSSGFPLFLQQCRNLIFLDLTQNKFSGELPGWIGKDMPNLAILRLGSNNFFGHIPIEIMKLEGVSILDLSNNNFSGAIPQYLENLKALTSNDIPIYDNPFKEMYVGKYATYDMGQSDDSFLVVIKGQVLQYRENTLYLMSIDLSCNSLTGEIPAELGALVGLINLNLSSNLLSGNIPYKIGNLRSLESLDLSKNKIGGVIPEGLSDLTYLSYLNLSYNNLSGRIPSGHQLDILKADNPASMYIGNPGLCGDPLPRQCTGPPSDPPANGYPARWSEDGLSQMDFLLGLIIGFVAGTWMVFFGLLFLKTWRHAYFGILDKLYDRLYVISILAWRKWFGNTDIN